MGLRSEWRGRLQEQLTARVGFDVEFVSSRVERSGSITSPPREGDAYVFGRPPSDQVNYDDWKTSVASAAPYAEVDYAPFGETLHVTPGLRVEPYYLSVNRRRPADANLPDTGAPMLFVQGTRDAFARWDLLTGVVKRLGPAATLHEIPEGDHSFAVPRRTGLTGADVERQIHRAVIEWLEARDL